MNRFDRQLRYLAKRRVAYWRTVIDVEIVRAFRRRTMGERQVRKWLRVEIVGQRISDRPETDAVDVVVGLPGRKLKCPVLPSSHGHRNYEPSWLNRALRAPAVLARAAAVHEAWLTLHGKDPS